MEINRWAGKWSFRVNIWRLWFGANFTRPAAFIIWNGPVHCWQLQTWEPKAAHWKEQN